MKRSCNGFECKKYGKECNTCKVAAGCMPTCDDCKNKSKCNRPKDLNR